MDKEKVLQFVAEMIDGKLVVCDDGYVICCQYPGVKGVDFIFDENGAYEKTIQCNG